MENNHIHILHIGETPDEKINNVSRERLSNLLVELENQNITNYSIITGYYNPLNTKESIHKGHNLIVRMAKEKRLEYCIIAEDDIVFSSIGAWEYFLSQIPTSYDIFSGLYYAGDVKENRVINGISGIMSLYVVHSRFYDFFLSLDTNTHIDRELGQTSFKHEYYICNPMVVKQRGGYSFNLRTEMFYDDYLVGKELYRTT